MNKKPWLQSDKKGMDWGWGALPLSTAKCHPGLEKHRKCGLLGSHSGPRGPTPEIEQAVAVTPSIRVSRLYSPRPELRGARRKEGHVVAGDRKEKHSFELQEEGRVYLYWV